MILVEVPRIINKPCHAAPATWKENKRSPLASDRYNSSSLLVSKQEQQPPAWIWGGERKAQPKRNEGVYYSALCMRGWNKASGSRDGLINIQISIFATADKNSENFKSSARNSPFRHARLILEKCQLIHSNKNLIY